MDSLDLLRSLTNGVNSKVSSNSSETEGVSYKVTTSLRDRKKSNIPTQSPSDDMKKVRDTYKEEIIEEVFEEDIIEEEIIEEEIVEEDTIEKTDNDKYNEDIPIFDIEVEDTEDIYYAYNNEEVVKEEIIEELIEEEIIEEEIIEEPSNLGHVEDTIETTKNESEHKLEDTEVIINEPIININEKKKIDRCGNPFKRGPRNKNKVQKNKPSKVQQVLSELKEKENLSEVVENVDIVEEIPKDNKSEEIVQDVVLEPKMEEVSLDFEIEDMLLQSVFDELESENLENVDEIVEEPFIEEESIEAGIEDEISISEEPNISTEIKESEEEIFSEPKEVKSKPVFEEVVFGEDVDFSFDDLKNKEEKVESNVPLEEINEVEEKFKNCKYYGGMSVEEFLRENPNYREAMYVEHFYNKALLEELKMKGIILYKKGIYRL